MRKNSLLDSLLPKIRQAILAVTILQPNRWWYLSEMAQHLHVTPSSLQRELSALTESGILQTRRESNRVYYQPNPQCPILPELRGLLVKTVGLADILMETLEPFCQQIESAFVYGSVARGEETAASDVDLMIIGSVRLAELAPRLRETEKQLQRPVNPTLFTVQEFARKAAEGHHFVTTVLNGAKIYLKGNDNELDTVLNRQENPATRHQFN